MWSSFLALGRKAIMGKKKPTFYAVAVGRKVGIFGSWPECEAQVTGSRGARFKGFNTQQEAINYIRLFNDDYAYKAMESKDSEAEPIGQDEVKNSEANDKASKPAARKADLLPTGRVGPEKGEDTFESSTTKKRAAKVELESSSSSSKRPKSSRRNLLTVSGEDPNTPLHARKNINAEGVRTIEVYTDGASSANGKRTAAAGWGVYWPESDLQHLNESERLSGPLQTNNRAELMGIIRAVQLCPDPKAQLVIYTDSQYCIKAIDEWQSNWRKNRWLNSKSEPVLNKDLIRLLERELRNRALRPTLIHVKGHSSNEGNQEADRLAVKGAAKGMVEPHLWKDMEPSDSEEENQEVAFDKAVKMWEKFGFTLEQARKRAGASTE